jgi:hypothetical protein
MCKVAIRHPNGDKALYKMAVPVDTPWHEIRAAVARVLPVTIILVEVK